MLMNQIARKNWTGKHCGLRSGFLLGALAALRGKRGRESFREQYLRQCWGTGSGIPGTQY